MGGVATGSVLRVGVVTARPLAVWHARCVEQLAAIPGVTITRWLEQAPSGSEPPPASTGPRSATAVPTALVGLAPIDLEAFDHARPSAVPGPEDPSETVDVLLDLTAEGIGTPSWAGEVWRFGYGRAFTREAARAAIVDYTRGSGMTRVALIREGDGAAIREGWLQTVTWWRGELLDHLLTDVASWPATAALERIDLGANAKAPGSHGGDGTRQTVAPQRDRMPMPLLRAGAVGRRMVGTVESLLGQPDWNIGIIDAPIERRLSDDSPPVITWLPTRPGHYAADPFAVERNGVLHVLFEDYDQAAGIGTIQHLSIAADGRVSEPEVALETGVHASYPFLLEHDGSCFMVPETSAAGELALYEAEQFPGRWRRVATLLPGIPAVDASIVRYEGRWWMFATRADHGDNHNLFVWHASDLIGPWVPHLANPVKTDVRSSRPGGTPFVVDGSLYRPAQDGSRIYGGRVVVNRVEVLTERAFRERPVTSLAPQPDSPYPDGLHTLSAAGNRTLVDGNAMHLVADALPRTLGRTFGRLGGILTPGRRGR